MSIHNNNFQKYSYTTMGSNKSPESSNIAPKLGPTSSDILKFSNASFATYSPQQSNYSLPGQSVLTDVGTYINNLSSGLKLILFAGGAALVTILLTHFFTRRDNQIAEIAEKSFKKAESQLTAEAEKVTTLPVDADLSPNTKDTPVHYSSGYYWGSSGSPVTTPPVTTPAQHEVWVGAAINTHLNTNPGLASQPENLYNTIIANRATDVNLQSLNPPQIEQAFKSYLSKNAHHYDPHLVEYSVLQTNHLLKNTQRTYQYLGTLGNATNYKPLHAELHKLILPLGLPYPQLDPIRQQIDELATHISDAGSKARYTELLNKLDTLIRLERDQSIKDAYAFLKGRMTTVAQQNAFLDSLRNSNPTIRAMFRDDAHAHLISSSGKNANKSLRDELHNKIKGQAKREARGNRDTRLKQFIIDTGGRV